MSEDKKAEKLLTEEQARKFLEKAQKGDLHTLTDRIWVRQSPKEQEPQKKN